MDAYKQPAGRHDDYSTRKKEERPTQFINRDNGREYERAIERQQRALQNYDERERKNETEAKTDAGQPDVLDQLDSGDWKKMDPDAMSRFFEEHGTEMTKSDRTEFLDLLMEKMMKESEQLAETDIEILKLGSEMKSDLEHMQSGTDNDIPAETQSVIDNHGTEFEPKNGQGHIDLQESLPHVDYDLEIQKAQADDARELDAVVSFIAPEAVAPSLSSEISTQIESQGFEKVAEIQQPAPNVEAQFKTLETELMQPNLEVKPKGLNAETESEAGSGEFG